MASAWIETLKSAKKTCLVQDGRRKMHFLFSDGSEMAEEYDSRNSDLLVRRWKKKGALGGQGQWEYEVGEHMQPRNLDAEGMMESSSNPIFSRKDTRKTFQWRVRNLPYPLETYDVRVDAENRVIIIKTTNKKYYKKFAITDMDRAGVALEQCRLSIAHANNTLLITYEKPPEMLQVERQLQTELAKVKAMKDGDMECNPS